MDRSGLPTQGQVSILSPSTSAPHPRVCAMEIITLPHKAGVRTETTHKPRSSSPASHLLSTCVLELQTEHP